MVRGESVGARVLADVVETQRCGVPDQLAEDTVPSWQVADPLADRRVDAARDEPLEPVSVAVENADRRVARAGQLTRDAQQLLEHGVDL
jgi:hypothetical protein